MTDSSLTEEIYLYMGKTLILILSYFILILPQAAWSANEGLLSLENIDSTFAFLSSNTEEAREARQAMRSIEGESRTYMDLRVKELASVYAKDLPSQIDEITTMDSVILVDRVLNFYYTVDISSENDSSIGNKLKISTVRGLCSTPMSGLYLMFGYGYRYVYYDKNGKYLYSFKVTVDSCNYGDGSLSHG